MRRLLAPFLALIVSIGLCTSTSWAISTATVLPLAPLPVLPSNPSGSARVSSLAANDVVPANLFGKFEVNLAAYPTALCNDGTKPVYYFRKGVGRGASSWVIWLEGGGGCSNASHADDSRRCNLRKGTAMSSSSNLSGLLFDLRGIFDASKTTNPDFYSYNMVLVHYCSSDFWRGQGVQLEFDNVTHEKWWFSGQRIVEAVLKDLESRQGLMAAKNIILTGTSAGAFGMAMNANMIRDRYPTKDVVLLLDAGWGGKYPRFSENFDASAEPVGPMDPELIVGAYDFLRLQGDKTCLGSLACGANAKCLNNASICALTNYNSNYLRLPYFVNHDELDRVLGILGYSFNICSYNGSSTPYKGWLEGYNAALAPSLSRAKGLFLTRTGIHGMAVTDDWAKRKIAVETSSYALKDIFGAWYFGRASIPSVYRQPASTSITPDQEVRAATSCQ